MFAYAQAEGVELRLDATEIQVRRPPARRGGRRAFVPGKKKATRQCSGSRLSRRVMAWPGKFKKNAPDWYGEIYERQRKAHSSRRIRVEHGIAHLKNWRALARHLGRREHISDTVQAIAGLLSHQQITDPKSARQM
ncbi:hypothetical protein [Streptomyces sp. NPDC003737]|uniref:hypothetical protein n=1 Tax=Streptomyces sp. NPDC003737 TaxID=3364685 RepID=UPI00368028F8